MNNYLLKITGKDTYGFIKDLYKMHINLEDIKYDKNTVYILADRLNYLKIKKIKTLYKIEIVKYYGLIKYKMFLKKYYILLITFLIGFIFFLLLINTIFDIEVSTDNLSLKNEIITSLNEFGLKKHRLCITYGKKELLKKKLLFLYKDKIEWIEIKRYGTKYVVLLEERKKSNDKFSLSPRNIVAKKNGIITKINAKNGEIIGRVGQYVKKGDILISGSIHKKDDVVSNIDANGTVYAETWYTVSVLLPFHYSNTLNKHNYSYDIDIRFLNKDYHIFSFSKYKSFNSKSLFSINNFFLPFSISFEKKEEIKKTDEVYTISDAYFKASVLAREKLFNILGDDISIILEKQLKTTQINSKINVVIFYKVIENITEYKDIDNL